MPIIAIGKGFLLCALFICASELPEQPSSPSEAQIAPVQNSQFLEQENQQAGNAHLPDETENNHERQSDLVHSLTATKNYFVFNDTIAQWTMAFAAIGALCVSVWAVIILKHTLRATRDAVLKAKESSDATISAIETNAHRELRAYISVEPLGIIQLIGGTDARGQVAVRNVGKIPARKVQVVVRMISHPTPSESQMYRDTLYDPGDPERSDRVIQPSTEMRQGSKETETITNLCQSGHNIFVWGTVLYDDGFGKTRFTRFCHRYATASFNRDEDWNRKATTSRIVIDRLKARYHPVGNEAD